MYEFNSSLERHAQYETYLKDLGCIELAENNKYQILDDINIYLNHDPILTFPWEPGRFCNCLSNIGSDVGNSFEFQPNNHFSYFLLPFGLTIITNGNHSVSSGIIKGEGFIKVKYIEDVSDNYDLFYFDGTFMRSKKNNEKIYKVKNFECGALYEIGRLIKENDIDFFKGIKLNIFVSEEKPIDAEWKILKRNNKQFLHYYIDNEGECEVDVHGNTIIFTSTPDSYGLSTTNAVEILATYVAKHFGIPLNKVDCYEHYDGCFEYDRDIVHHIVFRVENGSLVDPHFTRTLLPDFSK